MKAAYIKKTGSPLEVSADVKIPDLKAGQVLVDIAFSGVCHSQLMEVRGWRGEDPYVPHMLGHEATGVVRSIGEGVEKVKAGDRVVLGWIKGQGQNVPGSVYDCCGESINAGGVTTFMQSAVVSENRISILPVDIPMKVGVLFGCAMPTGAGIILNEIKPKQNSTIGIFGLGGIGMSALVATRAFNCSKVLAFDIEDSKLNLALDLGATDAIRADDKDLKSKVMDLTDGQGLDYIVEAAGLTQTIEKSFSLINKQSGLCVFASHPKYGEKIQIDPFELICGKQIRGSWGGASNPDRDIPVYADLYRKGHLPVEKFLSQPYKLEEVNKALDDLESRKILRALLEINPDLDQ